MSPRRIGGALHAGNQSNAVSNAKLTSDTAAPNGFAFLSRFDHQMSTASSSALVHQGPALNTRSNLSSAQGEN